MRRPPRGVPGSWPANWLLQGTPSTLEAAVAVAVVQALEPVVLWRETAFGRDIDDQQHAAGEAGRDRAAFQSSAFTAISVQCAHLAADSQSVAMTRRGRMLSFGAAAGAAMLAVRDRGRDHRRDHRRGDRDRLRLRRRDRGCLADLPRGRPEGEDREREREHARRDGPRRGRRHARRCAAGAPTEWVTISRRGMPSPAERIVDLHGGFSASEDAAGRSRRGSGPLRRWSATSRSSTTTCSCGRPAWR